MTYDIRILCLGVVALMLPAAPASPQAGKSPKSVALCLPPGAKAPVACGTARAGQALNLVISTTTLPSGPLSLLFSEEGATGRAPRAARADVSAASLNGDGSYNVIVPRELCASTGPAQFEIQDVGSAFNQAEGNARPLGVITVVC